MPTKVLVNAGQIVINDGSSFLITDANGSINADLAQGFFVRDTRLISDYEISLNHHRLVLLASSMITHHSALWEFTNPELPTARGMLPYGRLLVTVRRDIVNGMHEDIDISGTTHSARVVARPGTQASSGRRYNYFITILARERTNSMGSNPFRWRLTSICRY